MGGRLAMHFGEPHSGMSRTLLLSFVRLGILGVLEFGLTVKLLGPARPRTVVLSDHLRKPTIWGAGG
jgi:hypothetical protein